MTVDISGLGGATPDDEDTWTISLTATTSAWTFSDDGGSTSNLINGDSFDYYGVTVDVGGITEEANGDRWTADLDAFITEKITASFDGGVAKTVTSGGSDITLSNLAVDASIAVNLGTFTIDTDKTISFNTTKTDNSAVIHIGANADQKMNVNIGDMSASALKINTINVITQGGADSAITTIQNAIESVSAERSKLGAFQNRLDHTINNLGTSSENLTAAESRIRDVDMAKEMMEQTKNSILSQAAQAMLAQANQQPQGVLQLLR